jgi:hypothetical protein
MVLLTRRVIFVAPPPYQTAPLEPFEALAQDVGRDMLGRLQELGKAALAVEEQVAHHQERPPVTDDVERAGDRTGRSELASTG